MVREAGAHALPTPIPTPSPPGPARPHSTPPDPPLAPAPIPGETPGAALGPPPPSFWPTPSARVRLVTTRAPPWLPPPREQLGEGGFEYALAAEGARPITRLLTLHPPRTLRPCAPAPLRF